ncbi:YceI family protein [Campylobacter curvus]|uniref:YceI family protein n=1 Tax=Campylobacter curvus TaxID=200 RepID=UPI0014704775|nr:YceI family protein [Campylobacter curvus]
MKKIVKFSLVAAILASFANAAVYEVDAAHTNVGFKVKHLSISKVNGNFGKFSATIDYDKSSNTLKTFEASIDATSINTQNETRDNHLRSADFFDTAKFEKITYKMMKFEKESPTEGKVVGTLTMHGITKPVVLKFELGGFSKDQDGKKKIGFSLEGHTKRSLFEIGLDTSDLTISDKVELEIEVEAKEG